LCICRLPNSWKIYKSKLLVFYANFSFTIIELCVLSSLLIVVSSLLVISNETLPCRSTPSTNQKVYCSVLLILPIGNSTSYSYWFLTHWIFLSLVFYDFFWYILIHIYFNQPIKLRVVFVLKNSTNYKVKTNVGIHSSSYAFSLLRDAVITIAPVFRFKRRKVSL
jgi:hypothetical protein